MLDVLEGILREAESDAGERSVGMGGHPNVLGQVELDASLMEGRTRRTGSVAALQGHLHPVSVARQVLERLPHEILVGAGAARFAREIGAEPADLLTAESEAEWKTWLRRNLPKGQEADWRQAPLADLVWRTVSLGSQRDTAIALVATGGDVASGTSTSGWPYKYPGRVGDSALIGSGHYADSRWGAAACTHTGEMTIRAGTARAVVLGLEAGMSPERACREAVLDLRQLREGLLSHVVVYAMDPGGNHFAASTGIPAEYWWWQGQGTEAGRRLATVL